MSVLHRCITLSHRAGDCAADVRCVTWHRHPWFDQVVKTDVEPAVKQFFLRRGYYGAVSYTDYHFGLMLDALDASGHAPNTVVLLTGDHGCVHRPAHTRRNPTCRVPMRVSRGFALLANLLCAPSQSTSEECGYLERRSVLLTRCCAADGIWANATCGRKKGWMNSTATCRSWSGCHG
eukprot:m.400359 g.400359  ORF g.400359 m.400359 type:complete len:178 (-) comp21159_c0_seq12:5-538(-)